VRISSPGRTNQVRTSKKDIFAMKTIIDGKRYDTEKAELIGEAWNGGNWSDFSHWEAALYRTPKAGRYFLAGQGGPMTMWRKRSGSNGWSGSEGIKPLDAAEAFEWAQQHLPADVVEATFGDAIEDA
jgi:hypothetical protein